VYLGVGGDGNKSSIGKELLPLIKLIGENTPLVEIDVTGNKFGDELAEVFADELRKNTHLKSVRWDRNFITATGWQSLLNTLQYNRTLCHSPFPRHDVDKCVREAKNKEMAKEKTLELLRTIADILKKNAGGEPYTSLIAEKQGRMYYWEGATRPDAPAGETFAVVANRGAVAVPSSSYSSESTGSVPSYGGYGNQDHGHAVLRSQPSFNSYNDYAPPPPPPFQEDWGNQGNEQDWTPEPPPPPDNYSFQNDYNQEYDTQEFEDAPAPPPPPPGRF